MSINLTAPVFRTLKGSFLKLNTLDKKNDVGLQSDYILSLSEYFHISCSQLQSDPQGVGQFEVLTM